MARLFFVGVLFALAHGFQLPAPVSHSLPTSSQARVAPRTLPVEMMAPKPKMSRQTQGVNDLIGAGGFVGGWIFKEPWQATAAALWVGFVLKFFFLGGFGGN